MFSIPQTRISESAVYLINTSHFIGCVSCVGQKTVMSAQLDLELLVMSA